MDKQILLPERARLQLHEDFGVATITVLRALRYKRNTKQAQMIRKAALERGGLIYTGITAPEGYIPEVDTMYDPTNGIMCQTFCQRLLVETNLKTGQATVFADKIEVLKLDGVTTATWSNILYSMQQMYNKLNA